ncbi:chromosomal replication initiator protein DnaA [Canibacter sp. lx-45]|uniref:chromosomal replication initiator protein DnaA n=1 Tax=Canibacter zhuwentaonis TaxID=2837491 RepID=UPI001BDCEDF8|nr:chromosomal replication initiator protein DnaA [Canibacter zhuwentaonis]MBT1035344.1 chromosomal replication initiator protein DnaA [Canibacter zhuwentaonis]
MTKHDYIWDCVTQIVRNDSNVSSGISAQLNITVPAEIINGLLYLTVSHNYTQQLLETKLRENIISALQQIPEASDISDFVVLVNETVQPDILTPQNYTEITEQNVTKQKADSLVNENTALTNPEVDPLTNRNAPEPVYTEAAYFDSSHYENSDISLQLSSRTPVVNKTTMLNPKLVFEGFVTGGTNDLAHATAVAVAEMPGAAYQPLFIYGDSGLGKTHLLHAIGNYTIQLHPGIKVRYITSEEFTNQFINSVQTSTAAKFKEDLCKIDILLIDDIQFLENKQSTIDAFFNIFNELYSRNKQIVATSDVPAKNLTNLTERLVSRFQSGLSADIQAPDIETRIAILRLKSKRDQISIPPKILEYIATKCTSNVRQLEGALLNVVTYANMRKKEITQEFAATVLKNFLVNESNQEITAEDIISETANYFRILETDITGKSRNQNIVLPRQVAMHLCRELTNLSLPKIGNLFGGRDHTTVLHSTQKIQKLLTADKNLYDQIAELIERLRRNSSRKK